MELRDNTTPVSSTGGSDDVYDSTLRKVVLPILGGLALIAVSVAILYAFFKHFKLKRKAREGQTSHQ
jgi:phosphotransferase system  glucose/maltose/N-acetylglucosamine-specific IIC component